MNAQLSIDECKVMWVIGALERLATLGLIGPDIPLRLSSDAVEDYMQIDDHREHLFDSDFEIINIFTELADIGSEDQDPDQIKPVIELLMQYKNHRTDIVRYALSQQLM